MSRFRVILAALVLTLSGGIGAHAADDGPICVFDDRLVRTVTEIPDLSTGWEDFAIGTMEASSVSSMFTGRLFLAYNVPMLGWGTFEVPLDQAPEVIFSLYTIGLPDEFNPLRLRLFALLNGEWLSIDGERPLLDLEIPSRVQINVPIPVPLLPVGTHDLVVIGVPDNDLTPETLGTGASVSRFQNLTGRITLVVQDDGRRAAPPVLSEAARIPARVSFSAEEMADVAMQGAPDQPSFSSLSGIGLNIYPDETNAVFPQPLRVLPGEAFELNIAFGFDSVTSGVSDGEDIVQNVALMLFEDGELEGTPDDWRLIHGRVPAATRESRVRIDRLAPADVGLHHLTIVRITESALPVCRYLPSGEVGIYVIREYVHVVEP